MNDQLLGPLVESWLKDADSPPSDIGRSIAQIESRLPQTRQWSRWWPLPFFECLSVPLAGRGPAGGSSMFSVVKLIAAAAIVALFGGFLLTGILTAPQEGEVLPATMTGSPSPEAEEPAFPTGTFVAEEDDLTLEFRADGTCQRAGVPCTYGILGSLYSETTFEDPSGAQVPATYYWDFDGESLTFELWGVDKRSSRQDVYTDRAYRAVGETIPLGTTPTDFPTGWLVSADGSGTPNVLFREDGSFTSGSGGKGKYAVSGDLFTEITFTPGATGIELVPATYHWRWDGERLMFRLWGEDSNGWRKAEYLGHVFVMDPARNDVSKVRSLILSHPQLDDWVTVELMERDDGSFVATATINEEPLGEGVGDTLQDAIEAALDALGQPLASDMAESVKG